MACCAGASAPARQTRLQAPRIPCARRLENFLSYRHLTFHGRLHLPEVKKVDQQPFIIVLELHNLRQSDAKRIQRHAVEHGNLMNVTIDG
mmetsp:Transcript_80063/g.158613  ORF Transcript_80063/g.158613 Transcript_80063/m.158613 type:complete len:90 (-) Transcript_80063:112-381(-)